MRCRFHALPKYTGSVVHYMISAIGTSSNDAVYSINVPQQQHVHTPMHNSVEKTPDARQRKRS